MKNQNDMIISIVAVVVALIALGVLYGTKPDPKLPASSPDVKTAAPTLGEVAVPMVNGIGSGGTNNRTAGFGGPAGGGGGARPGNLGAGSANGAPPATGGGMSLSVGGATSIP